MRYFNTTTEVVDMFVDRTAGESTKHNRLTTWKTSDGNIALVAYGWLQIATYDESRNLVTVHTGHKSVESKTVNEYLNLVSNRAEERGRNVIQTGTEPKVGRPNDGTRFIGKYIGNFENMSAVEEMAQELVHDSLRWLNDSRPSGL